MLVGVVFDVAVVVVVDGGGLAVLLAVVVVVVVVVVVSSVRYDEGKILETINTSFKCVPTLLQTNGVVNPVR